jgi:hypothetical protein
MRGILLSILGLSAAAALWVAQCSGPKPVLVEPARVEAPDQPGDPYKVTATVRNTGPGHGQVRVTFRLIDDDADAAYQKDESVQLERGETTHVIVEIPAPPATYRAEVEAEYPPE